MEGFKKCTKCKELKQLPEFNKDKSRKDGYSYTCRSCQNHYGKNYYSENKETVDKKHRDYYEENKEERSIRIKEYRDSHKEQYATYHSNYQINNKEKLSLKKHIWYLENKEQYNKKCKEYRAKNIEIIKKKRNTYYTKNAEHTTEQNKIYRKTLNGIKSMQQFRANRRLLGYNPINDHFEGSEYHHLRYDSCGNNDSNIGVFIPSELHKSIWHNGTTGQGMEEINKLAIEWYLSTCNSNTEELQKLGFNNIEEFVERYKPKEEKQ